MDASAFLRDRIATHPKIAVVLGSGLGAFADSLSDAVTVPYGDIPGWPQSTAIGHAGKLVVGTVEGMDVAVLAGRAHLYEGYTADQAVYGIRNLANVGVDTFILTNAAGGINPGYGPGNLVLISDHINLLGQNPLTGPNNDSLGPRFPDMSEAYSKPLRAIAQSAAKSMGLDLPEGVYAAVPGPSYETPAEIRYLRAAGADLVGMSTVPETIAANHMGRRVLGISCVTNYAAGVKDQKLDHAEVLQVGEQMKGTLIELLRRTIQRIASQGSMGMTDLLIAAAIAVRKNAHAPFSKFQVGAAVEDEHGRIHTGCNVENATYGLTCCAERVAIFKALSEGARRFRRVAIVADTDTLTPPCGACRQILWEFCGDIELTLSNLTGTTETVRLATLFPRAFDASFL